MHCEAHGREGKTMKARRAKVWRLSKAEHAQLDEAYLRVRAYLRRKYVPGRPQPVHTMSTK